MLKFESELKFKFDRILSSGVYKDINYVTEECEEIAEQLSHKLKWLILKTGDENG